MYSIDNYNFSDKKVIIRVDFNVPLNNKLEIVDATRITTAIPTIQKVLSEGGAIILITHLGRPKGKYSEELSLKILLPYLEKVLDRKIMFADSCIGEETGQKAKALKSGEILLLENLRFHNEEMNADEKFAEQLASLGDTYINNAFGTAHRAHASTTTIAKYFPHDRMFGYLVESEMKNIDKI